MNIKRTDAGRVSEGFGFEKQDCTVRALALCFDIPYKEAYEIATYCGRKPKRGMYTEQIERAMAIAAKRTDKTVEKMLVVQGERFRRTNLVYGTSRVITRGGDTVQRFLWKLPKKGTFYLTSTRHAFTVKDGVVLDNADRILGLRARMDSAWKIVSKSGLTQADINECWAALQEVKKLYE